LPLFNFECKIKLFGKFSGNKFVGVMEVNKSLEEKLWSISSDNHLDKETCDQIIDYLLARLSDYLQTPLELVGDNWIDGDAFSTDFRGVISPKEAFGITLGGTLGMELIDDDYGINTSVNLYLFGSSHRLTAGINSLIYLEYIKGKNDVGDWVSHGWAIDEFDEYEDIEESEFL